MPRALLINPWIHDFAAYDFWARPLGLLELGSALRAMGYDVSLMDGLDLYYPGRRELPRRRENGSGRFDQTEVPKPAALKGIPRRFKRYGMPLSSFQTRLASQPKPEVILVSSVMTYWYTGVAETIAEVRRIFPETPVILGGVYATLLPEHARAHSGADMVAGGDFRVSLPPILRSLGLPGDFPDTEFFPAWDLYTKIPGAAIITGRGCPARCPYCAAPVMYPRLSPRAGRGDRGDRAAGQRLWGPGHRHF